MAAHAPAPTRQAPTAPRTPLAPAGAGGGNASTTPSAPHLTAAAERIRTAAAARKQAIAASFAARRARITAHVATKVAHVKADGTQQAQTLLADIAAREQEIRERFAATRAGITAKSAAQKAKAHADEVAALANLARTIAEKRRMATEAAETEAAGTEADGHAHARRADAAVQHAHSAVDAAASSAESRSSGAADNVRSAVRSELQRSKGEVKEGVRAKGQETSQGAIGSARKAARGIRDGGRRLAEAVGAKATDLEKSIRDGTAEVLKQIDQQAQLILKRLVETERRATAGLAQARSRIQPALAQATTEVTQRVQQVGDHADADLDAGSAAVLGNVDHGADAALSQLSSVQPKNQVSPEDLQTFETQVTTQFDAMCTGVEGGLTERTGRITGGFDQATAGFSAALGGKLAGVRAQVATAVGETHALTDAPGSFDAACTTIHDQVKQSRQQGVTQYAGELDHKLTEARTGYTEQRARHNEQIGAKVGEFESSAQQVATKAPDQFSQTAAQVVSEANKSTLQKIWDGIVEGLKRFWDGMKWFLLALLVVFVILVGILVAIGVTITGAILLEVLGIALAIVGVIFLVIGVVMATIHRLSQAWDTLGNRPWWQKLLIMVVCSPYFLAVIVGDVLGVTPLLEGIFGYDAITGEELSTEERWARATMGALSILTLLLLRRALKGGKGTGTRPVDPARPPVDPVDPARPGDPVDPARPADPPVDPPRPAYDPTTRTLEQLRTDANDGARPGETDADVEARRRAATDELARRAETLLPEQPRRVNVRGEEGNHPDSHTTERHGADIPFRRADAPGARTIEGRIFGDPPWPRAENASLQWISDAVMNNVVNQIIAENWASIRQELVMFGEASREGVETGNLAGKGFVNENAGGFGPRSAVEIRTSKVTIRLAFDAGPPPDFHVITAFPEKGFTL